MSDNIPRRTLEPETSADAPPPGQHPAPARPDVPRDTAPSVAPAVPQDAPSPVSPAAPQGAGSSEPTADPIPLSELPEGAEPAPYQPVMERPHPLTPVITVKPPCGICTSTFFRLCSRALWMTTAREAPGRADALRQQLLRQPLVVDDRQVRIEHNFIWHNSDKVPFTKIQSVDVVQPFAARLLGLAQLRIDVGSGGGKTIDYLSRSRAYQMRDYLVARAHGQQVSVSDAAQDPVADALNDVSRTETVLLTVPPQRLVLAAVLSTGFLVTLLLSIAALAGITWFQEFGGAVGLIPLLTGLVGIITNSVVKQWNYRLVRSGQALKVSRGMTSLVSQTLPTSRIQAISITQHLLWRPFGIHRVKVDVLGYGGGDEEGASDVLLPAGTYVVRRTLAVRGQLTLRAAEARRWRAAYGPVRPAPSPSRRGRWRFPASSTRSGASPTAARPPAARWTASSMALR